MDQLKNKVAIITGGGTGIGRGIALALAHAGVRVVICGRRKDRLEEALHAIWETGGGAVAIQADVAQAADVRKVIEETLEAYGRIDFLINNAGISEGGALHETTIEEWDRIMDINLRGPFLAMREILPHMRAQRSGHIINISSESGIEYYPGDAAYGTSKHALNDLSELVQRENQEFNIRVNTICPGMVVTEMTENESGLDRSRCLYPEDIADLTIWLLTRRSNVKIGSPILIQTMLNPWE